MKEVKKCSISGIAFTMEADAFQVLSRYLESLNDTYRNTDGGKEIVEDIEARIAELILSHQDAIVGRGDYRSNGVCRSHSGTGGP